MISTVHSPEGFKDESTRQGARHPYRSGGRLQITDSFLKKLGNRCTPLAMSTPCPHPHSQSSRCLRGSGPQDPLVDQPVSSSSSTCSKAPSSLLSRTSRSADMAGRGGQASRRGPACQWSSCRVAVLRLVGDGRRRVATSASARPLQQAPQVLQR